LAQIILGYREFIVVQTKGITLLQGEIIAIKLKYTEFKKKKSILQNQQAKFNQSSHKLSLVKGIHVLFK
jgi:hypothetical protein